MKPLLLIITLLLPSTAIAQAEEPYRFDWSEEVTVTSNQSGMDLSVDGIRLPIDIQDHSPTLIAPEWQPVFTHYSPTGHLKVGDTTIFSFRDCRENIGRVEWFVRNDISGRDPIFLSQNGRCKMKVRWRDGGRHIVNINYSYKYYTDSNDLRTVTSIESDPLIVEVKRKSFAEKHRGKLLLIGGIVAATSILGNIID